MPRDPDRSTQTVIAPSARAYIIAGPNGAGKTTFARCFLPTDAGCTTFINADLIAAGLSPFRPEAAALHAMRLMVDAMHDCVARRMDFAIETTLAGRAYLSLIRSWQRQGFLVKLIFLMLPSADEAVARVRQRVSLGGHDVPEEVIRRRFEQGWINFQTLYRPLVNAWVVFDSSGSVPIPQDNGVNP
jgi:predicted ABC-type ATPase